MQIGRKIYYDNRTGEVLVDTGERSGSVRETTREEDFTAYLKLSERVPESVGMIQLEYDQLAQDFDTGVLDYVDVETKQLYFRYPGTDPEAPQEPRKPLSVEVEELNTTMGTLLLESANDKATIASLEETVGTLLMEVATLKGGAE